jgi:LysM repeat protein
MKRRLLFVLIALLISAIACGLPGGTADPGSGNNTLPDPDATATVDESPRIGPDSDLPPTWTPVSTVQSVTPQVAGETSEAGTAVAPPAGGQETYVVQPGDTLAEIATAHGVTLQALVEANNIQNIDVIEVDQVLIIPR